MEKEKLIKYLRAQMGDPFMVDMEAMEGAERGEFKSDREKRMNLREKEVEEEAEMLKAVISIIKDSVERERAGRIVAIPIESGDVQSVDEKYGDAYVKGWRNGFGQGAGAVLERIGLLAGMMGKKE